MSNEVTVLSIGANQLRQLIDEGIANAMSSARNLSGGNDLTKLKVDRKFLEINFGWSRRTLERMERDGLLREVPTGDGKSKFYNLGKCLEVHNKGR